MPVSVVPISLPFTHCLAQSSSAPTPSTFVLYICTLSTYCRDRCESPLGEEVRGEDELDHHIALGCPLSWSMTSNHGTNTDADEFRLVDAGDDLLLYVNMTHAYEMRDRNEIRRQLVF